MKRFICLFILAAGLLVAGCSEYDDSEIRSRLEQLEKDVATLKADVARANSDIAALQTLISVVQQNQLKPGDVVSVTSVKSVEKDGVTGWEISFSDGRTPITIWNGKDSTAPVIGVTSIGGILYWTVDNVLVTDPVTGEKIPVKGIDGSEGVTPKLKIEEGYWYVSYDGEATWVKLGKATSGGSNGVIFRSVEVVDGNVVFTLSDGMVYTIPLISAVQTEAFNENDIVLSLGAVSDIHIGNEYGSEAKFTSALNQLKMRAAEQDADGLDALMVAGDLVNTTNTGQITTLKTLYEQVFDPKEVPFIYAIGNHDMNPGCNWSTSTVEQNSVFRSILGDDYFLTDQDQTARVNYECRHCIVGNYHILCITPNGPNPVVYDAWTLTWLNSTLKAITDKDPDRYVMLITHPMIYNTVYGSDLGTYWYTTSLTSILAGYPQVVTFSGHLHFPLNDPRSVWQGAFTSFGCASVSYMAFEGGDYENKKKATVLNDAGEYSEGLLIQLDASGNLKATRMDFYRNAVIGKPWYLKAPATDKSHLEKYNHTSLRAANTAPSLSSISVDNGNVTFAAGTDDEFVHHYSVSIKKGSTTVATKNLMSDFYRSPQPSMMKKSYTVSFDLVEEGDYTASVVAYDSWGAESEPVTADFTIKTYNVADVTPYLGTYTLNAKIFQDGQTTIQDGTIDVAISASGKTPNNVYISGLFQDAVLPGRLSVDPDTEKVRLGIYFDGSTGQALTTPVTQGGTEYNYISFLPGLGTGFVSGTYNFIPFPITATANYVWWWGSVSDDKTKITFNTDNKQSLTNSGTNYYIIAISCVLSKTETLSSGNFASSWNKVYQANPGNNVTNGMTFTKK